MSQPLEMLIKLSSDAVRSGFLLLLKKKVANYDSRKKSGWPIHQLSQCPLPDQGKGASNDMHKRVRPRVTTD
jgi:hypothetical protein